MRSIIRKPEVLKRTGLSDTTIWRLEKVGDFPKRVQLTDAGSVGWVEAEVDRWIHDRVRGAGKRPAGVSPARQNAA
jgi:prophage regulatory protein